MIHGALQRASRGGGGALLISGEAGMGKTALVTAALDDPPVRVAPVWGAAWEGGAPAMWPWIQVLRRLAAPAELVSRTEGGGALSQTVADVDGRRFRLFDDICEFVIGTEPPCVRTVVIDDLHWADQSSIELLAALARRLRDRPVLVIATYRMDELDRRPVRDLLRSAEVLELAGIESGAVAALLEETGVDLAPGELAEVWRRTGGNPLFVREFGRLLRASGDFVDSIPVGIAEVLERRLARLPQPVVTLLSAVAVCSPGADAGVVADVIGVGSDVAMDGIELAISAGIVAIGAASTVTFSHDLFRAALLRGIGPQRRRELHATTGRVLAARYAEGRDVAPSVIAEHFLRASPVGGNADAAHFATLAAERAVSQYAFADGATWYQRALEAVEQTVPVDRGRRINLLIDHADAARRAGASDDARQSLTRATELAHRSGLVKLLPRIAIGVASLGSISSSGESSARAVLEEALEHVDPGDDAIRARLLASLARDHYHQGGGETDPVALAESAVAVARASGDPGALWFSLAALHDAIWQPGSASERLGIADQMLDLAEDLGDLAGKVEAQLLRYSALFELGDPKATVTFQRYAHLAGLSREPRHRYVVTSRWAMQALVSGRYADADRLIEEAAAQARRIGEADGPVVEFNQRWALCSDLGRRAELLETLEVFSQFSVHPIISLCLAMARLAAGDRTGAESALARACDVDLAAVEPAYGQPWVAALLVEAASLLGRVDQIGRARAPLEVAGASALTVGAGVVFHGAAQHHLGLLHAALGQRDEAASLLRLGEAFHRRIGAEPWLVRSRIALADVIGGAVGSELRASAFAIADGLGMTVDGRAVADGAPAAGSGRANSMTREGDVWTVVFRSRSCRLKHAKGLDDLAVLLAQPGVDVAATHLYGAVDSAEGGAPILDDVARRAYAKRLHELEDASGEADARGDATTSAALAAETEAILRELRTTTGLGGRRRRLGDPAERSRKAVTGRLRYTIDHIATVHPELGAHLVSTVTTGTWCSYRPSSEPMDADQTEPRWEIQSSPSGGPPLPARN